MPIAAQRGTCAMLGKHCCLWVNRPGQVQTNLHKLAHQASDLETQPPRYGSHGKSPSGGHPGFAHSWDLECPFFSSLPLDLALLTV
jgi:hypothetical protein